MRNRIAETSFGAFGASIWAGFELVMLQHCDIGGIWAASMDDNAHVLYNQLYGRGEHSCTMRICKIDVSHLITNPSSGKTGPYWTGMLDVQKI
jgi:hypothetical protein